MAVHLILLIILPITYIACEQALNYQLRFLIRYEFLFRIPNEKFPGFQNPDYLTWAIHSKCLKYAVWRLSRSYHGLNCFHANVSRFKVQDSLLQLYQ